MDFVEDSVELCSNVGGALSVICLWGIVDLVVLVL